ncbi:hypothetical protein [Burkholderia sp. MSMB1078WGS]|uniref:hypothetical protein n=1 Tax=Burkholderia sp. MSMB1078WGS TaxID=1637900 RepID=UPI0012E35B78|nr:hypothetical protein [Burkholderia sp. MSMB1078WGS]
MSIRAGRPGRRRLVWLTHQEFDCVVQIMASFNRRGCVDGLFVSAKVEIAVVRFNDGFVRCLKNMIRIRRERFPFVVFIDIGDARAGGATSRRARDGGRGCVGRSLVASQWKPTAIMATSARPSPISTKVGG